jgi:hypothetical protein
METTSSEYFVPEKIYSPVKAILFDFQLINSIPPSKMKEKVHYYRFDA